MSAFEANEHHESQVQPDVVRDKLSYNIITVDKAACDHNGLGLIRDGVWCLHEKKGGTPTAPESSVFAVSPVDSTSIDRYVNLHDPRIAVKLDVEDTNSQSCEE